MTENGNITDEILSARLEWLKTLARNVALLSDPNSDYYNPIDAVSATDDLVQTVLGDDYSKLETQKPDDGKICLTGDVYVTEEEFEEIRAENRSRARQNNLHLVPKI